MFAKGVRLTVLQGYKANIYKRCHRRMDAAGSALSSSDDGEDQMLAYKAQWARETFACVT